MDFWIKIEGLSSIDGEIEKKKEKIRKQIPIALAEVGGKFIDSLQEHIHNDWYLKQKPKYYVRRTDDPRLGQPLGDLNNMKSELGYDTLLFTYEPIGDHMMSGWHERDGDTLIQSIQEGLPIGMMPRPFWNNFADEQMESGIMESFIAGMKPFCVIAEGNDVVPDGDEKL